MDVDERASGTEVALRPGGRLRVALEENPSTGHRWRRVRSGEPLLSLGEDRYEAPADAKPGAPGRRLVAFDAVAPGRVEIALEYARPWEQERPARRFELTVTIEPTRVGRRPSSGSGRRRCPARPRPRRPPG